MRKRALCSMLLVAPGLLFLDGCAAVLHGTKQTIQVASLPPGAAVMVQGVKVATTPGSIEFHRKDHVTLRFEKEGYKPVEIALHRDLSGAVWGNLLLGGVIGLVVDFGTGAAYTQSPKEVTATMETMSKAQSSSSVAPGTRAQDTVLVVFRERVPGEPVGEKLPTP